MLLTPNGKQQLPPNTHTHSTRSKSSSYTYCTHTQGKNLKPNQTSPTTFILLITKNVTLGQTQQNPNKKQIYVEKSNEAIKIQETRKYGVQSSCLHVYISLVML